jgi:predicted RNase H-like nuclease (RuvC/YqgF family)
MADVKTPCTEHEEQIQNNTREIAELQTEIKFKEKRIDDIYLKIEKMEDKLDKLNDNVNKIILQSTKGDTDLELRLKAIETELQLQKQTAMDNHTRLSSLLAIVGVGLTIITILINVYFNIIH